jgi:hypothetical protein
MVELKFNYSIEMIWLMIMFDYVFLRPKGQCAIYYFFIFSYYVALLNSDVYVMTLLTPSGLTLRRKTRRFSGK